MTDEERLQAITEQLIIVRDNLFRGLSKSMQKLQAQSINEVLELPNYTQSAKQEQGEPVAWESVLGAVARGWCYEENANKTMDSELAIAIAKEVHALYTTPQQSTWVGLSDDDCHELWESTDSNWELMKRVEAKLKDKNNA